MGLGESGTGHQFKSMFDRDHTLGRACKLAENVTALEVALRIIRVKGNDFLSLCQRGFELSALVIGPYDERFGAKRKRVEEFGPANFVEPLEVAAGADEQCGIPLMHKRIIRC